MTMSKCEKTCIDCIHYDLCDYNNYKETNYFGKDKELYRTIKNNIACRFFKDKSLFVEFPCKVGDKVYITDGIPNEVTECEITSFTVDCDGVGGFSYEPLDKRKAGFASCDCLIAEWGDTVFLDRAEAERKLKEVGK